MKLSNQLSDYVTDSPAETINQTLFAGWTDQEFADNIMNLATALTPPLAEIMFRHVQQLPIGKPGVAIQIDILPADFALTVATMIDEHTPDWNITQKTAIYLQYLIEMRTAAQKEYMHRVHTRPDGKSPARAVDSDDPGEVDIRLPKRPNLN